VARCVSGSTRPRTTASDASTAASTSDPSHPRTPNTRGRTPAGPTPSPSTGRSTTRAVRFASNATVPLAGGPRSFRLRVAREVVQRGGQTRGVVADTDGWGTS
jgi:hypothetical protein